jgi:ArsR family transcriptional regulator
LQEVSVAVNEETTDPALRILRLLADETRWRVVRMLRVSDHQVGELVEQLGLPQNLISYHLGVLKQAGLVRVHRSEADARSQYYGLDLAGMLAAHQQIGQTLQLPLSTPASLSVGQLVVFLCTGNSARSQIAEGWLRQLSGGSVLVRSAGTQPRTLHPLAIRVMAEAGVDIGYQQSKDIQALQDLQPTVVVTVCDRARELCAQHITAPLQIHWSIADPARFDGSDAERIAVFRTVRDDLRLRVQGLLAALPRVAG